MGVLFVLRRVSKSFQPFPHLLDSGGQTQRISSFTVFYKDNMWMCFDCKDGHVASRVMSGCMNEVLCDFFPLQDSFVY